jgi:WD40 repeat protein
MTQDTSVLAHNAGAKAKVFISYSRKDMAFADRIEAALKARAFEPQIDRAEIHAFEDWWERIEALIVKTDTIVFALSPDAVASDVCQREVAFATSLNKRVAPIVCRPVNDKSIPRNLARLNFVFFTDEARFEESADKLAEALSIDINWVRKHTDFGEQARRWSQAGRPGPRGLLLRSPVLEEAEQWIAARPADGPSPTETTRAFISESRRAATRRRNILTSSLGMGLLVALALAGLAFWQRAVAIEQERLAVEQRDAAQVAQSRFLTDRANREALTGDAATSVLLALAALPDERESVRRPYVPAAELALFNGSQKGGETALLKGHDDAVDSAAFSPDGMRVVTASADTTARIWDAATAAQVAVLKGHDEKVWSAAFSPDGRRIVTASQDKTARIWDVATGAQIAVLKHDDWVLSAAFSPDGRRVVTGSSQAKARIWDAATGAQIIVLAAHYSAVTSAAFSPDGRRVVTASEDKTARIWDGATGALIVMLEGHDDEVNSAAFSPDGRRVVTASQDHTARIWDAATGAQVAVLNGEHSSVRSAAFSPDGKRVVTALEDRTARIWDAATAAQIATLKGHDERVLTAAFSPDGRRVVTASEDRTARIWDVAAEAQIVVLKGHDARIRSVEFSPDGRCIVTTASISASDKTTRIWDAATGAQIAVLRHDDWVQGAAFTADGQRVVTMSRDKTARIWDASTGTQIAAVKGRDGLVERAAFSPDGKHVLTMALDRTAVWDIVTGAEIVLKGHNSQVNGAAFSPDGRRVVTASDDTTARIWDAATGAQIAMLEGHSGQVTGAAFSPDGRRVVTASNDSTARIWDAATAAQIAVLKGHDAVLQSAAFGPDGRRVMTASNDSTARIWDATTGAQIAVLMTHDQQVSTAALSPDGRRVLIMSWDKGSPQMRIWHVFPTTQDLVDDTKKVVPRCLTRHQRDDAFLDATPPAWCIEMEKWPYQTQDWKLWLTYTRANDGPPLADAPEWQAWVAVRKAK